MIIIDGSQGEGGGQILRTALALSLVTGESFRMERIRAGRKNPGLMRQHLTAVSAAAELGNADVSGDKLGSFELRFSPRRVRPGKYHFSVGTAGSCTLVLQTVLPALIQGTVQTDLSLEGGTHNPMAPPFDFLEKTFLPVLEKFGPKVTAKLERPGFYPAGGGCCHFAITPVEKLQRVDLCERGEFQKISALARVSHLPLSICERELKVAAKHLDIDDKNLRVEPVESDGPGNVIVIFAEYENITETFTGFGEKGVSAERVAEAAVGEAVEYLNAGAPVGKHLADQLLLPMALAGGGVFRTLQPTPHTMTNIDIIRHFLEIKIRHERVNDSDWEFEVSV